MSTFFPWCIWRVCICASSLSLLLSGTESKGGKDCLRCSIKGSQLLLLYSRASFRIPTLVLCSKCAATICDGVGSCNCTTLWKYVTVRLENCNQKMKQTEAGRVGEILGCLWMPANLHSAALALQFSQCRPGRDLTWRSQVLDFKFWMAPVVGA